LNIWWGRKINFREKDFLQNVLGKVLSRNLNYLEGKIPFLGNEERQTKKGEVRRKAGSFLGYTLFYFLE
jgi:hypothetical protein